MDLGLATVGLVLHAAFDLAVGFGLGNGVALVVELFASAESDLYLEAGAFEVDLKGDQGIALLGDESLELHDLLFVHEESAVAKRLAVEDVAVLVGTDVDADGVELSVNDLTVGVLEVDAAAADAFDLGAVELDARFIFFVNEVVVPCLFVLRDNLDALLFGHG